MGLTSVDVDDAIEAGRAGIAGVDPTSAVDVVEGAIDGAVGTLATPAPATSQGFGGEPIDVRGKIRSANPEPDGRFR